ncbi:MAG: EutN/CcmL family microcompartment protein [Terriglobales bacterium]
MMLAKVIGTVVCTVKYPSLEGQKLLLVQPVNKDGVARGKPLVAIDAVGAGVHETVYWCRGREAALAFDREVVSDASIVGIVDEITTPEQPVDSTTSAASGPACTAVGPAPSRANSGRDKGGATARNHRGGRK